ncbi:MAG: SIS domain-containing protein [Planctomycetes bacterium]|nr:SIS domain-containing protein [Planctomycetota bacterium]
MKNAILNTINEHKKLIDEFEQNTVESVIKAAELIVESYKNGGCVYICGNGGSAADAQHIAGELVGRFLRERKGLPAVAFSTDTSVITAVANDYGYGQIFARQTEALVKEGDVLWGLSTSGTSENIVSAVKLAKEKGAKILTFTGRPDTPLEKLSDVCVSVNAKNSYSAQEIHQIAYHIICDLVEKNACK